MQGHVSSLIGKTTDASKKVYSASMYIPNLAIGLTGEVVVSAKELVFALTEVKFEIVFPSLVSLVSAQLFHRISKMFLATNTILFSTIFKELSQNMCFYMYKNNRKLSEQTRGSKTIRIFLSFCHVVK